MQVDESIVGREHVVPSIVQVGFLLLEVLDSDRVEEGGLGEGVMSTEEIGINMLKSLFEIHEMSRTEVCSKTVSTSWILFINWFIWYDMECVNYLYLEVR